MYLPERIGPPGNRPIGSLQAVALHASSYLERIPQTSEWTPCIDWLTQIILSLYVIDSRTNHRLSDSHKETLGNIVDAVMEYLETSR